MSNFRPLVHPFLIDFGEGSCSFCCSSCDRGKTKSTPSPKTEVWTLDLGLEFDKIAMIRLILTLRFWFPCIKYKFFHLSILEGKVFSTHI